MDQQACKQHRRFLPLISEGTDRFEFTRHLEAAYKQYRDVCEYVQHVIVRCCKPTATSSQVYKGKTYPTCKSVLLPKPRL